MRISVIGAGYVGLVTGACLAARGHEVVCVDKKPETVAAINAGRSPLYEPGLEEMLAGVVAKGALKASQDIHAGMEGAQVTILAVGTPLEHGKIDLSQVREAARDVGAGLAKIPDYHVVCIKSTVVPGTTDTVVRQILEETAGKAVGEFGLAMNPEFLREGSAVEDFLNPDRIIIGAYDQRSYQTMAQVYAQHFDAPVVRINLRTAEMIKYASNALLACMISFANDVAGVCEAAGGIDVQEVMAGVALDKRISPRIGKELVRPELTAYLQAGCGFGGSCLPKDVQALIAFSREKGYQPRMLEAIMLVNRMQARRIVEKLEERLGSLAQKRVAVLGLAFKPGTDDVRDSPAQAIIMELLARQARVVGTDPVALDNMEVGLPRIAGRLEYVRDVDAALAGSHAAVLVTPWPEYRNLAWRRLLEEMAAPVVVDCRRALDWRALSAAGAIYLGTGWGGG